jgi:EmrB/QacA subfamily drug resistance transporter
MRTPCDEAVILSAPAFTRCREQSAPWILTATILASSMAFIDSTVVNVALPTLQTSFHATLVDAQWVVEAYGMFLSALIITGGVLGDLYGRRRMFLAGVFIFAAASAVCGMASSISQLVVARAVQGVGAALLVPGSLALISASFDEKTRGQAIGTWSGYTAMMTAGGPVLGGWLIQHASWRWTFLINLPLAAAVLVISLLHVPESRRSGPKKPYDWMGAVAVTLGLTGIVKGFLDSTSKGWAAPAVLISLSLGFVFLLVFLVLQNRVDSPMIPLAMFRSPGFAGASLLTLFLYAALGIFFFLFPMNLIQVHGYSVAAAGAAGLPMILLMFFLSRWSGGLIARYPAKLPLTVGPLIVAVGFLLFTRPSTTGSYWSTFFPAFLVLGFGMATTVAPLTTFVLSSVDLDHAGVASGINNAIARVAGVLAIAVMGIVMVSAFTLRMDHSMESIPHPPEVLDYIHSNATRLASMDLPPPRISSAAQLDADTTSAIRAAVSHAFVFGFRIVMVICAGLALISSAVALLVIPSGLQKRESPALHQDQVARI